MPSDPPTLRRRDCLAALSTAGVLGVSGCLGLGSDSRNQVTVGRIKVGNGYDEPLAVSVLLQSAEEVVYWETFELSAYQASVIDEHVQRVDGPWPAEPATLDVAVTYQFTEGDASGEGTSGNGTRGHDTSPRKLVHLGTEHEGCLVLEPLVNSRGEIHVRIRENAELC